MTSSGDYAEDAITPTHSPILGWMFDGTPIYGPYGYTDPHSAISAVKRIESGYSTRQIGTRNTFIDGTILTGDDIGPPVDSVEFNVVGFVPFAGATDELIPVSVLNQVNSQTYYTVVSGVSGIVQSFDPITGKVLIASVNGVFSQNMWVKGPTAWCQISNVPIIYNIGYFVEDYSYSSTGADLDVYNGRFPVTSVLKVGEVVIRFTYVLPSIPEVKQPEILGTEQVTFTVEGNVGTGNAYYYEYYDDNSYHTIPAANMTQTVTNYQYEIKKEDDKRNIFILKPEYLNVIFNDLDDIMPYKKGAAQYVSDTLKKGENIRLYQ